MPYKLKNLYRHKFPRVKYKVSNWPEYNKSLKNRGSLTIWISEDAIKTWNPEIINKKKGGQIKYSDLAIETALTIRKVYNLKLRQTEGFLKSIIALLNINIQIPDYTTICKRAKLLKINIGNRRKGEPLHIIVDSTGVSVENQSEWYETKYGNRKRKMRTYRLLHIAIDERTGEIISCKLTTNKVSDHSQVPILLEKIDEDIASFTADGTYDKPDIYDFLKGYKLNTPYTVIIPPRKDCHLSKTIKTNPTIRDQNLLFIQRHGRMIWQKHFAYNKRSKVENTFFRYKVNLGEKLYSKIFESQEVESKIGCKIINKMTKMGMPISYRV